MFRFTAGLGTAALAVMLSSSSLAQVSEPDWAAVEEETLRHFRALLQFDTSDPPGRELPAGRRIFARRTRGRGH